MPYFPGLNTVFTHIPKAAGESVVKTLKDYSVSNDLGPLYITRKHETMLDIKKFMSCDNKKYEFMSAFKFAIVRNPWSRLFSWFSYNKNMWETMPDGFPPEATSLCSKVPECEYACRSRFLDMDFNTWVSHLTSQGDADSCDSAVCPFHKIAPQYLFVVDNGGFLMIDDYLKFEHLGQWNSFLSRLNIKDPPELLFENKGVSSLSYKDVYNKESIDLVKEFYKYDIKFFGYSF